MLPQPRKEVVVGLLGRQAQGLEAVMRMAVVFLLVVEVGLITGQLAEMGQAARAEQVVMALAALARVRALQH